MEIQIVGEPSFIWLGGVLMLLSIAVFIWNWKRARQLDREIDTLNRNREYAAREGGVILEKIYGGDQQLLRDAVKREFTGAARTIDLDNESLRRDTIDVLGTRFRIEQKPNSTKNIVRDANNARILTSDPFGKLTDGDADVLLKYAKLIS